MKLNYLFSNTVYILTFLLLTQICFADINSNLLPIEENNLWGFIDTKGNVVIKPQFFSVGAFSDDLCVVQLEIGGVTELPNGKKEHKPSKFGYINKSGNVVLKVPYEDVKNFVDGFAPVRIGDRYDTKYFYPGKYGFIDKSGKLIVEPQFDQVSNYFSEDLMAVKVGKKWGFINRTRNIVIKPDFSDVEPFSEGIAAAKKGKKWGYIDKTGKFIIQPQFNRAKNFSDGVAQIRTKLYGDWGYIDKTGKIIIPTKYNSVSDFINGKASVKEFKDGKFIDYCINKKDEKLSLEECEIAPKNYPIDKMVDGKKVFVDEFGKTLFENNWDGVIGFYKDTALVFNFIPNKSWCGGLYVPSWIAITDVCLNWGYIDKTGKYIWKQSELK